MRFGAAESGGNADDEDDEEKDAAEVGERNGACAIESTGGGVCAADAPATPMIGENELRFDAPACRPSPAGRPIGVDCATRSDWNCCCALPCGTEKGKPFSEVGGNRNDELGGGTE